MSSGAAYIIENRALCATHKTKQKNTSEPCASQLHTQKKKQQ